MSSAIIKSVKFKGYKKFSDWVEFNFEVNPNKYSDKNYVKDFELSNNNHFYYNSIIGIIGNNASGKTTVLDILEKYSQYIKTDAYPFTFNSDKKKDPFDRRDYHGNHDYDKMPTLGEVRKIFKTKIHNFLGSSSSFNPKCDEIELLIEIVVKSLTVTHNIKFRNDGRISENVFIKKRANKNEVTQQVFNKNYDQEITFKTFISLLDSQEILINNKYSNVSNEEAKIAFEAILEIGNSFVETEQSSDLTFFKLSSNIFFDGAETKEDMMNRMKVMEAVARIMDPSIEFVKIDNVYSSRFNEFEFVLKDGVVVSENSLSTGTIKFTNFILKAIYYYSTEKDKTKYILVDEIDNSWHPNLTRKFVKIFQYKFLKNFNLICTFHNPYVASEFREDALYVIPDAGKPMTWVKYINEFNKDNPENKLRLEHSFVKKYLDDLFSKTSLDYEVLDQLGDLIDQIKF